MDFSFGNALAAVEDANARACLMRLGAEVSATSGTLSTIVRNRQAVTDYALASTSVIAGAGLSGGGTLAADVTLNVGAGTGLSVAADAIGLANTAVTPGSYTLASITVDQQGRLTAASSGSVSVPTAANPTGTIGVAAVNGSASTFMRSDAAPAFDMTIARNWTAGVHTFAVQDVHTLGINLSTSGVIKTAVANGGVAYDLNDGIGAATRTSGTLFALRNTADSRTMMEVTWDGRFGFGYSSQALGGIAQAGHILAFLATDADSPTGFPTYVGILSSMNHADTTETAPRLHGLVGNAAVSTATGLSAVVVSGTVGSVSSSADSSFSGKVAACFAGAISQLATTTVMEPPTKDINLGNSAHFKGAYDHLTVLWCPNISSGGSGSGYPTNYPAIVSAARVTIQDSGCSRTIGTPAGKLWAIYGEHVNGTLAYYPIETGFMRVTYPRRTATTAGTTNAKQIWWEPWPMSNATAHATGDVRSNAIDGDTYFDDGTNFRKGLWEYAGAWYKLLQHKSVDAISGAAAPATLALTTGGATGPAAAAQNTWLQVVGTNGTAYWVPAWV